MGMTTQVCGPRATTTYEIPVRPRVDAASFDKRETLSMLREMAFVLHLARTVEAAILADMYGGVEKKPERS